MSEASSNALFDFRTCAEEAPAGTHTLAVCVNDVIEETAKRLTTELRGLGLGTDNCDRLWQVEAAIYDYIKRSNPDNQAFTSAEAFGRVMNNPERRAQTIEEEGCAAVSLTT